MIPYNVGNKHVEGAGPTVLPGGCCRRDGCDGGGHHQDNQDCCKLHHTDRGLLLMANYLVLQELSKFLQTCVKGFS